MGAAVLWLVSANVALVRLERADSKGCAGRLDLVVLRLLGRSPKRWCSVCTVVCWCMCVGLSILTWIVVGSRDAAAGVEGAAVAGVAGTAIVGVGGGGAAL